MEKSILGGKPFDIITNTSATPPVSGTKYRYIVPIDLAGATFKAQASEGDDFAVGGLYANAGFSTMKPIMGQFTAVTVSVGTVMAYYW